MRLQVAECRPRRRQPAFACGGVTAAPTASSQRETPDPVSAPEYVCFARAQGCVLGTPARVQSCSGLLALLCLRALVWSAHNEPTAYALCEGPEPLSRRASRLSALDANRYAISSSARQ